VARAPCAEVPDPPPRGARWVRPELVCEVRFTEVTSAGLLRQPVFTRLRADQSAEALRPPDGPTPEPHGPLRAATAERREKLALSRLDKIFWPVEGYTKGDLLAYYEAVWPWLGPYLRDRPLVLTRYPDGIEGKSFYQQNAPDFTPAWVGRETLDGTDFYICNDLRSLLYVVNSGAIPLHVWSARRQHPDRPDWLVIDLDPKGAPFSDVIAIARHIHALLEELGAPHFAKTSGQDGLHVLVPLGARLDHEHARALAEVLARVVCAELPERATIARPLAARGGKVYVDWLQNGRGKLIAAPLSVRPRPGAPVSMPLAWSKVARGLDPSRFTIRTAPARMKRYGDPCHEVLGKPVEVRRVLRALEVRLAQAALPPARPKGRER
jgi:bifunctional non-homologous end joining protein LigD